MDEFQRSFSMNSERVARLGANFIRGQQSTGVATTAKHFPGLGAASRDQNTDEGPVILNLSLHTLRTATSCHTRPRSPPGRRW